MSSEKPSSLLVVDAVKAQASKFRETKNALDARAKELEAMKAQLGAGPQRPGEVDPGRRGEDQAPRARVLGADQGVGDEVPGPHRAGGARRPAGAIPRGDDRPARLDREGPGEPGEDPRAARGGSHQTPRRGALCPL